ncbi:Ancient ubiquitous protein 1 [Eumeta japonica]|uniref:Ancient ubiquitous protein 1 n=1 Tax=Eumeta variegata TaxID=151549 RepID=A0A4C1V8S2_EUMVA|nr:Ancient ubiquitous protein 1 [Eumeta japonica]
MERSCSAALLAQPEGGPTNGRGLLRFADWPIPGPLPARVQPLAIRVERAFTAVTVHRGGDSAEAFPWSDVLWYLWTPVTQYSLTLLPPLERQRDDDARFVERLRTAIAQELHVEATPYVWESVRAAAGGRAGGARRALRGELQRQARQVREVLPRVPLDAVLRDLAMFSLRLYDATYLRPPRTIAKAQSDTARSNNAEAVVIVDISFIPL